MSDCEHTEHIERALFAMERQWGSGKLDKGEIIRILRGKS